MLSGTNAMFIPQVKVERFYCNSNLSGLQNGGVDAWLRSDLQTNKLMLLPCCVDCQF